MAGDRHTQPRLMDRPSGRSMFGRQADSRKLTGAMFSFGSGTRENREKVFITAGHTAVDRRCRTSPGAIYKNYSSLQKQIKSCNTTAPTFPFLNDPKMKWPADRVPGPGKYKMYGCFGEHPSYTCEPAAGFGTSNRLHKSRIFLTSSHMKENLCRDSPPVGVYETKAGFGNQQTSGRKTQPSFSVPKTPRFRSPEEETARKLPGAGTYPTWESIGKQMKSTFRTMPSYGLGCPTHRECEKRFLSSGHTRILQGTNSPSGYKHQKEETLTSFGSQYESSKMNSPSFGFGTSKKMVLKIPGTPGPGTYEN